MKIQIIVHAEVADNIDGTELFKKLDVMFRHADLSRALGFEGQVVELSEAPDPDSRTQQLREVADALVRVGFDDLPPAVTARNLDEAEPLEVRLSLSISQTEFPSVALDELLQALEPFDDGELGAMGPMGVIALFDAFGKPDDTINPYQEAVAAAAAIQAAAEQAQAEAQAKPPTEAEPNHESELDNAEAALQESFSRGNSDGSNH